MLNLTRILQFLALIAFANSQLLNIPQTDQQLADIYANLDNKERRLASSMRSEVSQLQSTLSSISSIAKLQSTVNNTINLYSNLMTIANFPPYQNISTCNDINIKITTIEMDIRRFVSLQTSASINASNLQVQVNLMAIYWTVNRASVASSLNFQTRIDTGNGIVRELLNYIRMLSLSISTEAQINANLKAYKSSYCICQSSLSSSGQSTISTLEKNMAFLEGPLLAHQTRILSTTRDAQTKVTTARALVTNASLNDFLAKLLTLFTKTLTANDYSNGTTTTVTSCTDMQARIGYVQAKFYLYVRAYGDVGTNLTYCNSYAVSVNATIIALNSTFNATQRSALRSAAVTVGALVNMFVKYYQDLAYTIGKSKVILSEIQTVGDQFCGCTNASDTTVTTTTEATTTPEEATTEEETNEETEEEEEEEEEEAATQSTSTTRPTTSTTRPTTSTTRPTTSTTRPTTSTTRPTTSTTVTTASGQPCGVFVDYNYLDTPDEPKTSGFSAGAWHNGAQSWVGIGSDSTCSGMSNMPARISIPPDNPGAYIPCNSLSVDSDTPKYLQNHPSLKWISTTASRMKIVTSTDQTSATVMGIGRMNVTIAKVGTLTTVGLIMSPSSMTNAEFYYMTGLGFSDSAMTYATSGYEILSC